MERFNTYLILLCIVVLPIIAVIMWNKYMPTKTPQQPITDTGPQKQEEEKTPEVPVETKEETPILEAEKKPADQPTPLSAQDKIKLPKPELTIDTTKQYSAVVTTTAGKFTVELNAKETPITVNNFVYLSRKGLYADTIFHRVIKGFMIQGGDPLGTGMGGPAYRFDDEAFTGEYTRGTLAMANAGPDTNGSQFFIMHADTPLQKNYVIFGKVTEGMDVVDKIATAAVSASESGEPSKPVNPVKIQSVEIVEN